MIPSVSVLQMTLWGGLGDLLNVKKTCAANMWAMRKMKAGGQEAKEARKPSGLTLQTRSDHTKKTGIRSVFACCLMFGELIQMTFWETQIFKRIFSFSFPHYIIFHKTKPVSLLERILPRLNLSSRCLCASASFRCTTSATPRHTHLWKIL